MANFFSNLFSAGATSLVNAVGDAIDKSFTSDEEKKELDNELAKASMQYEVEMATLGLDEKKAFLADTDSARDNQSRVQESENASWLAKNVHPMLAIGILGLTFFLYFWILQDGNLANLSQTGTREIVIYILGALTTISTQVAAYFFGSSQGSKDKQTSLNALAEKASTKQ